MSKKLIKALKDLETINPLQEYVKAYILDNYEDDEEITGFISDLMRNGCVSGMIGELCYYKDTNDFYDKFEDDIEDLIEEYGDNCGYQNRMETIASLNGADDVGNMIQEKNLLAWFGFERAVNDIADELGVGW